ncbi:uncharacterized protein [Rutidosis leptorrhynchoides]|uniref:uncharacterized protein n=1 Tax=Rutidosis leptorrhynchoides TaxID=125765 RepID=UPI003A98CEB3
MGKSSAGKNPKKSQQTTSKVLRNRTVGVDEKVVESESTDSSDCDAATSKKNDGSKGNDGSLIGLRDDPVPLEDSSNPKEERDMPANHDSSKDNTVAEENIDEDIVSVHSEDSWDEKYGRDASHDCAASPVKAVHGSNIKVPATQEQTQEQPKEQAKKVLYSDIVSDAKVPRKVNFRFIEPISNLDDGVDVAIPLSSVREATERYSHTLYGYFLGKRVAFPVVHNYVMNVWRKYGIEKIMMNSKGFFFFKFSSKQGMMDVMENGPWIIRTIPIILNQWTPSVSLTKEDLTRVPVWVKLHDVPLSGFTEDGLSCIASSIGQPLMLDSYTSTMCMESWGRPNYARALIEIQANKEMKETLVVATPSLMEDGITKGTTKDVVKVEYEWKPPRCPYCEVFGHTKAGCPKAIPVKEPQKQDEDGFVQVNKRYNKGVIIGKKRSNGSVMGFNKPKLVYRPVRKESNSQKEGEKQKASTSGTKKVVNNMFGALNDLDPNEEYDLNIPHVKAKRNGQVVGTLVDEESDVEEETNANKKRSEGASTPVAESRAASHKLQSICNNVCNTWDWTSNANKCSGGTRIILGWNPLLVQLMVLAMTDQVIHCQIRMVHNGSHVFASFVYADNYYVQRRKLWRDLQMHHGFVNDNPWVILGDFNASVSIDESTASGSCMTLAMREFKECLDNIQVDDVNNMGMQFTWNQKPNATTGILKKIDRVLVNDGFLSIYPNAYAIFQPYRKSDHSPSILKIPSLLPVKPKMFRFSNYVADQEGFKQCVVDGWGVIVEGHAMFQVVKRLRYMKKTIRKLMWTKGNIHATVCRLREELDKLQIELDRDPFSLPIREAEANKLKEFNDALWDEERFLKQKAKVQWLKVGDSNSKYFHKVIKCKANRSRINAITNNDGVVVEGAAVAEVFVQHYMEFLGASQPCDQIVNSQSIFVNKLSSEQALHMIRQVTDEEVKAAMFDIGDDKAPGPDGYSSVFFKKSWDIVGHDICKAVKDFFKNGHLLTEINHTILALLPKVETPRLVNDYRPISCCNVLYKCISKIITTRIKGCLDCIVSDNQAAFVPGRRITDNILITQEIVKNYHLNRGVPRCAFKVDIQKAYDTVDWGFLKHILHCYGFHKTMIKWIMKCVSTTSFSISINGEIHGFFKGRRGLRQGDPMSPYLFTLVMECLTLMIKRNIREADSFKYHPMCDQQEIVNVCFADDLFLLAHASTGSVKVISEALDEFKRCSGLVPSLPKSTAYFANVTSGVKNDVLDLMPFIEGSLPVRYLGVPLISSRLYYNDCKSLVDRVRAKISDWKNKYLSFAGRVQLISSVLSSMQGYWSSVFMLPDAIIKDIEKLMRGFLWCQGEMKKGKAKVRWKDVCLPKKEGGLGLKNLKVWNIALISYHVWCVITHKQSLWVRWIHSYRLSNQSFWEVDVPTTASYGWKKILGLREVIRPFIIHKIGRGDCTYAWHDIWSDFGHLSGLFSYREIHQAGFQRLSTVADLWVSNGWNWPTSWTSRFPMLMNIRPPDMNKEDSVFWRDNHGDLIQFSSQVAWESLRPKAPLVSWFSLIWFPQGVSRQAFIMWLLVKEKLKTQDKLKAWDVGSSRHLNDSCALCKTQQDSHDHLFFECPFSMQVWSRVQQNIPLQILSYKWREIMDLLSEVADRQVARVVVSKLLLSASVYFLWQERNARLFKSETRSPDQIFKIIFSSTRLKLMSLKFKDSLHVRNLKARWNL